MNPTHVHLLLNHVPILGSAFGALLLIYGILGKSKSVINAALIAFVITALFTIPVFLTGEPAEESVENIAGVTKASIEEHEESAEFALWMMEALGILSLCTLFLRSKENSLAGKLTILTLLVSLFTFAVMAKVGNEGGKIRHTELTSRTQTVGGNGEQSDEKDED